MFYSSYSYIFTFSEKMEPTQWEAVQERLNKFIETNNWSPRSSKYQSPSLSPSPSKPPLNSPFRSDPLSPSQLHRRLFSPRQKNPPPDTPPTEVLCPQEPNTSSKGQNHKTRLKNVMRRMKYKDKLIHLQWIIEQARALSNKHGHFYITSAMFVFQPENEIKLKIWIPNVHQAKCLHAIKGRNEREKERQFYTSLKTALREMFPTVSLGDGLNYTSIVTHIRDLRKDLTKRLEKCPSQKIEPAFSTPEYGLLSRNNSNKIVKVSRLVDFYEGISVIQEDTQQVSILEPQTKEYPIKTQTKKSKPSEETRASKPMTNRYSYRWGPSTQFESNLSNLLKENEGQFTLADSKLRSNTSRDKLTHNIALEMKKLLLN